MTDALPDTAPTTTAPDAAPDLKAQADKLVAEGKKAIALKDWEEGVEKYADALDLMRQLVGDFDPSMAPLLLSYGKALYELAYETQGPMGRGEVDKQAGGAADDQEDDTPVASSSKNFAFGDEGDGEEEDEAEAQNGESSAPAAKGQEGGEQDEGDGEGEGEPDEPEDDYNAAWEVLDVARTIYSKIVEEHKEGEGKEDRLHLSECYLALGDISLETENFPQAVQDYTAALAIKRALLNPSSRALASVHYQLATGLEFTPNGRTAALEHVQNALTIFKARLAELSEGKATEEVAKMTEKEIETEKADVTGLIADLELKIEELKVAPPATDLVSEGINHLFGNGLESSGSGSGSAVESGPVNDLTSMVKKKKKPAAAPAPAPATSTGAENGEKRKADDEAEETAVKKAKAE